MSAEKSIDLTPTWEGCVDILILALEHGSEQSRQFAREELRDMAKKLDTLVGLLREFQQEQKKNRDESVAIPETNEQ